MFLNHRTQYVRIFDNESSIRVNNAGAPPPKAPAQVATILSCLLTIFRLTRIVLSTLYVDDVTVTTVSADPYDDAMQSAADILNCWSRTNKFIINGKKTKEMILHFSKRFDKNTIFPLDLGDSIIERVEEFKLLGVVIRSDLSWCSHTSNT